MKVIVLNESHTYKSELKFYQWGGFALGWFGMRPVPFEKMISKSLPDRMIFVKGICSIITGLIFLYLSGVLDTHFHRLYLLSDLLILVGLSLILHFGVLNISTSFWRALGVDVTELFKSPYKARSLKEFWGKRWNIAFSEMTSVVIHRPLKNRYGWQLSMFAAFLFSGLLHEIAISVPVNAGYGLPLLYFLNHAMAMYAENNSTHLKSMLSNRVVSHFWVLTCIILPSPLLFHTQFTNEVLRPFRDIIVSFIL